MAKTWTFTGQDKTELRRLRTEVEADLGQVDGNLLDVYNAKSSPQEVYEKIRELAPPNDDEHGDEREFPDFDDDQAMTALATADLAWNNAKDEVTTREMSDEWVIFTNAYCRPPLDLTKPTPQTVTPAMRTRMHVMALALARSDKVFKTFDKYWGSAISKNQRARNLVFYLESPPT